MWKTAAAAFVFMSALTVNAMEPIGSQLLGSPEGVATPDAVADATPFDGQGSKVSLWLTSGFASTHLTNDKEPVGRYNQSNDGFGAELYLNRNFGIAVGQFNNSYSTTSHYIQGLWFPDATSTSVGPFAVKFGILAGITDGYMTRNNGGWSAAALPALAIEWHRIGANLVFSPKTSKSDAVLALQIKFKAL